MGLDQLVDLDSMVGLASGLRRVPAKAISSAEARMRAHTTADLAKYD
jgi:hypothetical protein